MEMKMTEIFKGLEAHRKYWAEKKERLEKELSIVTANVEAIDLSIESLAQCGDFTMREEEEKEEQKEETLVEVEIPVETEEEKKIETEKQLQWKHKNARVVKFGLDGSKLGSYKSQQKLADQLGVSGVTIGNWLKQPKDVQLQKRKFYLAYEY